MRAEEWLDPRLTWHLVQVDADSVVLRIAVEEHAKLQKRIGAVLDARNHAAWRTGRLLYIPVEVLGVFVQDQLAELVQLDGESMNRCTYGLAARTHRKLVLRPDLGDIERIESKLRWVGFFWFHDLDVRGPGDRLPFLDPRSGNSRPNVTVENCTKTGVLTSGDRRK